MLPEHRLAVLLQQVKRNQINMCLYHSNAESPSLYADHLCDRRRFPTENIIDIDDHQGEVWQVVFSHDGTKLASCGSEKGVIIWAVPSFKILHTLGEREHRAGVGNVSFSWDDSMIVTCCQDKHARVWDLQVSQIHCFAAQDRLLSVASRPVTCFRISVALKNLLAVVFGPPTIAPSW